MSVEASSILGGTSLLRSVAAKDLEAVATAAGCGLSAAVRSSSPGAIQETA